MFDCTYIDQTKNGHCKIKSWHTKSQKDNKNREKNLQIFWCKQIKNPMEGSREKIHQK